MEPLTHPEQCTDHPEWNESYYFVFYNKEYNLGGMSRLGFKPNKKEGMTFFFLFLPDGSAAVYNLTQNFEGYANPLQVGGVIHMYNKGSTWVYKFQGNMIVVNNPEDILKIRENPQLIASSVKVELDLNFNAINSVYEYSENMTIESREIGKKAGDKHWEQIATLSGDILINSKKYAIKNTIGQRDHTYGVRDWTGVGSWLYYVVWFNKKLCINPAVLITDDGRISTGGFLFKDGKNIPLKTIKIVEKQFRKDGIFPVSSELEIIDYLGEKHILKANVGPIIPVPFFDSEGNQSILIQSFGEFEMDGIKGGYGTFETLRKVK
ncbi:MAG: DUF7065 domain-containing protein [Promethearchaeota archaeon]|jgi:hypothetical protein